MHTTRIHTQALCFITATILVAACGDNAQAPLIASNVEITEPVPGANMGAGYLTLTNNTPATISISQVVSDQYDAIEIHETVLEGGVARMRRVPELLIAANSSVTLERGGKHLMMTGPAGEGTTVSLKFFSGDTLLLRLDTPLTGRHN